LVATPELAAPALRDFQCYNLGGRYITVMAARPPAEPKSQMREGFGFGAAGSFRPASPQAHPVVARLTHQVVQADASH
jgi:hypothetical protein